MPETQKRCQTENALSKKELLILQNKLKALEQSVDTLWS